MTDQPTGNLESSADRERASASEVPLAEQATCDATEAEESATPDAGTLHAVEGRYVILGEIARGGMGAILRGIDPDFHRELAIKVLLPGRAERQSEAVRREMHERFVAEAKIAGQLQHPGIVLVYELGEFSGARRYFTMKLVKGQTLAALLKERPAPGDDLPRFLKVFEQVCQTVAYAHSRRVIHRDLKPLNIMVGAFGEVQVMDWGLAKVMGKPAAPASPPPQSAVGATDIRVDAKSGPGLASQYGWGTVEYMPPEQARGEVDRLDARCDVFALGAILTKILTGEAPYVGDSPEVLRLQALTGELAAAYARLDACGADPELIRLARHCLAPRPDDRPPDAAAVASAVTSYLTGLQVRLQAAEVARATALVRAAEERKRRRLAVALAAAVIVLLIVGGIGLWWAQAVSDAQAAEEARQAAETTEAVKLALQEAAAFRAHGHRLLERPDLWKTPLDAARSALQRAELRAAGLDDATLAQEVLERKGELEQDERDRQMMLRLEQVRLRSGTLAMANSMNILLRNDKVMTGDLDAGSHFERAFTEFGLDFARLEPAQAVAEINRHVIKDQLAEALGDWIGARNSMGKGNDALTVRLMAVSGEVSPVYWAWFTTLRQACVNKDAAGMRGLVQMMLADPRFNTLSAHRVQVLALMLVGSGAPELGQQLFAKCQQARPDDFWINLYRALSSLGVQRNSREAARYLQVAHALRPDLKEVRVALIGELLACQECRPALELLHAASAANPGAADVLEQVLFGNAYELTWELERAVDHYRKAIRLKPDWADAHLSLGKIRAVQGRYDEAIAHFEQAIQLGDSFAGALMMRHLDKILKDIGADNRDAEPVRMWLGSMLAVITEQLPGRGDCYLLIGRIRLSEHQIDPALAALRQAVALRPRSSLAAYRLSYALLVKGDFAAAEQEAKRWLTLGAAQPDLAFRSVPTPQEHHEQVQRMLELDRKLPGILAGKEKIGDDVQRLHDLAFVCELRHYPVAALRYYQQYLTAKPQEADSMRPVLWRMALEAAAGHGEDARPLGAQERALHRASARLWMLQELARCNKELAAAAKNQSAVAAGADGDTMYAQWCVWTEAMLRQMKREPAVAVVRDADALAKLPAEEQAAWRDFWTSVETLLATVTNEAGPPKAAYVGEPSFLWKGAIDEAQDKLKPDNGVIVDERAFEKLWSAWRKNEPVPAVDFAKHFVAVRTVKELNVAAVSVFTDGKGGAGLVTVGDVAIQGFGYVIVAIERAGIKTFNGKPLPASGH
jgi:serine/threonine-protein kinase